MYRGQSLDVQGHPMFTLVFEPQSEGPHPGLVIAQHLPIAHAGLERDPFTIAVGERFAAAGYVCVIPFLFHWWPEEEDVAVKREGFRDDWTIADLTAAHSLLAGMSSVDGAHIGIAGHCWGGRVAWLGACAGVGFQASIICYGGRVKVAFADGGAAPIDLASNITCPVLGIFGNDDTGPSPQDVDDYEVALNKAGVANEFHRYDGAGHGFQDSRNPDRYRHEQSEDAWTRQIEFLDRYLK